MARIDVLPSIDIIRGFKGILDFYVHRGVPCVRAWPKYRPARQTAASLAAALVFGAIVKSYGLLGDLPLEAYHNDALDQTRTARDIMVTGVYGNLHEASMSDFLDLLTECRDFLSNLQALLTALDSIDTDELVVNVDQTVLPPSAATDAHQLTQITALQKLDDLQDALESKALDRLLVRGSDQLHSFHSVLAFETFGAISGADGYIDTPHVASGYLWHITRVSARDHTRPTTAMIFREYHDGAAQVFEQIIQAFAASQWHAFPAEIWLDYDDWIRVNFTGGLAGDNVGITVFGELFTKET